jgi:predicted Zn finger-like uncharacterized protein
MEVSCPACHARYKADGDKLRGKTARMRCKACDTVWLVSGPTGDEPEAESDTNADNRAAVVKRGAEREMRDLFASQPVDVGVVRQTLRPGPLPADGVAARNETSVLFTVESLRGAARLKTPEPERTPMTTQGKIEDDEGIIDLNALASAPKAGPAVASLFPSEPPPGAFARDANESAEFSAGGKKKTKGKLVFLAVGGLAAAALVIVGLTFAFKGEEPVARTAAFSPPPPPPAATTVAPPPADPTPTPPPPATASTSDDKPTPTESKKGKKKHASSSGSPSVKMAKVQSSGTDSASASKPAPKASDPCGCHGDFNCALACAAKH